MHLALYRKWRPMAFSDVVAQQHVTTTLQNQVKNGQLAHAYLFTGSRGTGKTTCARIMAKAVNCLHPKDGNPCLECEICRGLEDGSILDVTEMDAASNNGVDDVRDLREEANYLPSVCKYRVYIIDEVHMMSTSAFNALLKVMEEPPAHVIFILATTELHKVPQTILSRCQQYDFRRLNSGDIADRLQEISLGEGFALTSDAASMIAKLSDGGMRDAISLLDQCASFSTSIDLDTVTTVAGVAGKEHLFRLSEAIEKQDVAAALSTVYDLYESAKSPDRLVTELLSHYRDIMICASLPDPGDMVLCLPEEKELLKNRGQALSKARLYHILETLQDTLDKLSRSINKKVELEMAVIRLCLEDGSVSAEPVAMAAAAPDERLYNELRQLTMRVSQLEAQMAAGGGKMAVPAKQERKPAAAASSEPVEVASGMKSLELWKDFLVELSGSEPSLYAMLQGSEAYQDNGVLIIDSPNPLLKKLLMADNIGAKLADEVERKLGSRHRLRIAKAERQSVPVEQNSALDSILKKAGESNIDVHLKK